MGFIDQEEAKRRRKNLEREAAFYGAMDGASKFVKGDAIAGIVIMLINIVGGLVIGVLQQGMQWGDALRHFTLLTIGDGIVTQIPALVISVGTGLIVTRSSSDSQLGEEVLRQLLAFPRTLALLAIVMSGVALLPGIPVWPVAVLVGLMVLGYFQSRRLAGKVPEAPPEPAPADTEDPYAVFDVQPLVVQLGSTLARSFIGKPDGVSERVEAFRLQYAQESGIVIPIIQFRESAVLPADEYRFALFGEAVASGTVHVSRTLAIHPGGEKGGITGIETREPTYGLPALWIEESQHDAARKAKYTLVDPATVLFTHLCELVRQRSAELLTRAETERMLARVRQTHPGLVEELVPTQLAVGDVQKVLQNLLREKVPVRHLQAVVECLIDGARTSKDPAVLTEVVRQRLALSICNNLSGDRRTLHVLTLDPMVEDSLVKLTAPAAAEHVTQARPDPHLIDNLLMRLAAAAEKMMTSNLTPVLLCTPALRRHLRQLCERPAPHLHVLSLLELASGFELRVFATLSGSTAAKTSAAPSRTPDPQMRAIA
jgi:flagellar biosynthesis protein FlhA